MEKIKLAGGELLLVGKGVNGDNQILGRLCTTHYTGINVYFTPRREGAV